MRRRKEERPNAIAVSERIPRGGGRISFYCNPQFWGKGKTTSFRFGGQKKGKSIVVMDERKIKTTGERSTILTPIHIKKGGGINHQATQVAG